MQEDLGKLIEGIRAERAALEVRERERIKEMNRLLRGVGYELVRVRPWSDELAAGRMGRRSPQRKRRRRKKSAPSAATKPRKRGRRKKR